METVRPTWMDRVRCRLSVLAARPVLLFVVLLTANALARPYANFAHDARLYSVQVLNQADPGSYDDDLFLRFGSQDQFSIFSRLAAPLAAGFGLEVTFFGLYLVFNSLLILALQRLVSALVADRGLAVLGLIFLMVAPQPFGGLHIFQVQEPFLTPRILANALVLFGLERLLAGRYLLSFLLLLGAATMHPLMAQGGLAIWVLVVAWDFLPRLVFFGAIGAGALALIGLLFIPSLGLALFGGMDEEWREIVRLASAYNFPDEWKPRDWLSIAVSLSVLTGSAFLLRQQNPAHARFLALTALAGTAGLLGTIVGCEMGYAFLFQAQPYRILWVLQALQAPLGFWLVTRLWAIDKPLPRLTSAGLMAFFWISTGPLLEVCFPVFVLPFLIVCIRGLDPAPRRPDWLQASLLYSLVVGCVAWGGYKCGIILVNAQAFAPLLDTLDLVRLFMDNLGPMTWALLALAIAGWLVQRPTLRRAALVLTLALLSQLVFFVVPNLPAYRDHATRHQGDLKQLADFLGKGRHPGQPRPTFYSSLGRIDYLWVELRAKSYFDWAQIVGCLFNRGNAEEGRRRALLVRAFEVDRFREGLVFMPDSNRRMIEGLFQADLETLTPTRADLERLCLEEDLDYVILKQEFPGLVKRSFGQVHLYDVREIRLGLRGPADSVLAAHSDARSSPRVMTTTFQP